MGRWFCSVVLHDCRLAPLTDIAKGFRRANAKQGIDDTIVKMSANQTQTREAVEKMSSGILQEVDSLRDRVEEVNKVCGPKMYVVSNTTKSIHKVLATIVGAGAGAAARCGFEFAFVPKSPLNDLPSGSSK